MPSLLIIAKDNMDLPVQNSRVKVINKTTNKVFYGSSDSSGVARFNLDSGHYKATVYSPSSLYKESQVELNEIALSPTRQGDLRVDLIFNRNIETGAGIIDPWPTDLTNGENELALKVVLNVRFALSRLTLFGSFFCTPFHFTRYVPLGKSCVDAAYDRGKYLAESLPTNWVIDAYTWKNKAHTANVMWFQSSNSKIYAWYVDDYAPIGLTILGGGLANLKYVYYLGTGIPNSLYNYVGDNRHGGNSFKFYGQGFKMYWSPITL